MRDSSQFWRRRLRESPSPGRLFLLDGPSGAGKTTLAHMLADRIPDLDFIKRYTTRTPRPGVIESEYVFVSHDEFHDLVLNGELIEFRHFEFGFSYGLPWRPAMEALLAGRDALGIINLGNIEHVRRILPEAASILVTTDLEALGRRLRARSNHTSEEVAERLENAAKVERYLPYYDLVVDNREGALEDTLSSIEEFIAMDRKQRT